jgi:hypothetical protein
MDEIEGKLTVTVDLIKKVSKKEQLSINIL